MNALAVPLLPTPLVASAEAAPATWRLEVTAAPEPLLLARLLQKLAVPEIELLAVDYEAGIGTGGARATLRFRATVHRARLAAARVAKLPGVRQLRLAGEAARSGPAWRVPARAVHPGAPGLRPADSG